VGYTYKQSGWTNKYERIPAHSLQVQVIEIKTSGTGDRILNPWNQFQGESPDIRSIDLVGLQKEDDEDVIIRFEYEGTLVMDVTIESKQVAPIKDNCDQDKVLDEFHKKNMIKGNDSTNTFHVLSANSLFSVRVDLKMDVGALDNCTKVDDDAKIIMTNNVGYSGEADEDFLKGIAAENLRKTLLSCSPSEPSGPGVCNFNVTHAKDSNGHKTGGAGIDYSFLAGRPEIKEPYTKSLVIEAKVGSQKKNHLAIIFVEGFYKGDKGESFALPTHEPLMILRDPPGMYQHLIIAVRVIFSTSIISWSSFYF